MNKRIPLYLDTAAPGWMVQSDFDGTISLLDVTDTLLNRFGRPGWQALEDAWERGEIGSRECMKGQVGLLDMSEAELRAHLDTIAIDPGFAGFVAAAQAHGMVVQVVSDGIDYAIRHVLARHGLGHLDVIANRLVQTGERSWRLESPWASARCARASGNCKCERLAEQQAVHGRVLYVGDSTSDFCVSGRADFVLAKYKLIAHCESRGIAHAPFEHFEQATALLDKVVLGLEAMA
ncbi:2-hydroxy-3-keto-5-methylthiopentenyl-1-phosphatephosphatase [Delftia tsuruhatensis]|uniref:MtnX-like HAD-IB family phosphatase n=1 Tax=Delftia tsuruhatensis TaxID=180282 RepID=UPI001E6EC4C8|nr:MtnX-like HAD-IB family phosphatase [Delftia tsuruhatensis]CAB5681378.1 2-hydroxy-3-keto-5-methylthiopentenyl-1-phosphatephosphatase [Delftia tsuruhatensis]CAC9675670.1 2-hydroxy-3-keto-5-methylthiopentenyl-1-phosphatephosphatase [Delftia tsuruhatensis]